MECSKKIYKAIKLKSIYKMSAKNINNKKLEEIITKEKDVICGLAKASEILMKNKNDNDIKGWLSSVVNERMDVFLDIKDKIDLDNELKRLNKNLADKEKYVNTLKKDSIEIQ